MKTLIFKDSGQFVVTNHIPEIPATFEPGVMSEENFRKILAFNEQRDKSDLGLEISKSL